MDARISKAIMRSGAVFCCFIFLYWALVALTGGDVPSIGVVLVFPGLEFVLPWEISRWLDPLGAYAMLFAIAMVCGSSRVSALDPESSPSAELVAGELGLVAGAGFSYVLHSYDGLLGVLWMLCALGSAFAFGVGVDALKKAKATSRCMEATCAYGIGSGIGTGTVISISYGTIIGDAFALLMFVAAMASGGLCAVGLTLAAATPAATRRTFRWLSGN